MDWTTIIVAALAMVGTICGSWFGVRESNRLVTFRLAALEAKVTKHNNLVERMVVVEQSTKSAHHRIDELERRHGND